jgi:hypothetical protein
VRRQWQITREEQDRFAVASQNKAEAAKKAGKFKDEIAPVVIKTRKGETVCAEDEYIKDGVTYDSIAKLKPAFDKEGSVTAANASGINDGAAAVVLMTLEEAKKRASRRSPASSPGRMPASIPRSWARAHPASKKALEKAGWTVKDSGPDRGQRGVRRPGLRRQQGPRLGHREGQRQRRRHRHRPPDRRLGRARADHAAARDEAPQCQERASPPCASAAAWASPCALSATDKPTFSPFGLNDPRRLVRPAGDFIYLNALSREETK